MSLFITPVPSQGGRNLKFQTIVVSDNDPVVFQTSLNVVLDAIAQTVSPQGGQFLSDIQYQVAQEPGGDLYSALVIVGEWNPA